jgi:RimJ/RimL family protein N-acetyltransferase
MIKGQSISLRVWREDDLPVLTALRNDVALQAQLLARARGSRPEQVREWLQGRSGQTDRLLFVIAEPEEDQAWGFIQASDLDPIDSHADLGMCLLAQARGRGLGGQAIALLADYLRDQWHLRKLGLRVRADNAAALRCYEKAGFERCGLLRRHVFIDGRWQDVVLMERFLAGAD